VTERLVGAVRPDAGVLRLIYGAPTEQAARDALDARTDSEVGRQYPAIKRQWEAAWEQVIPFFAFPPEVRKVIYTTNMIESINYQLRKITKTRGSFLGLLHGCLVRRSEPPQMLTHGGPRPVGIVRLNVTQDLLVVSVDALPEFGADIWAKESRV